MNASSSSSSKKEDYKCMEMENNNNKKKLISNCLIALPLFSPHPPPPFLHFSPTTTLFKSHNKSNKNNKNLHSLLTMKVSRIVHNLHNSIVSTADRCFGLFQILASRNPFLSKVFSLSDDFRNFSQVLILSGFLFIDIDFLILQLCRYWVFVLLILMRNESLFSIKT